MLLYTKFVSALQNAWQQADDMPRLPAAELRARRHRTHGGYIPPYPLVVSPVLLLMKTMYRGPIVTPPDEC